MTDISFAKTLLINNPGKTSAGLLTIGTASAFAGHLIDRSRNQKIQTLYNGLLNSGGEYIGYSPKIGRELRERARKNPGEIFGVPLERRIALEASVISKQVNASHFQRIGGEPVTNGTYRLAKCFKDIAVDDLPFAKRVLKLSESYKLAGLIILTAGAAILVGAWSAGLLNKKS